MSAHGSGFRLDQPRLSTLLDQIEGGRIQLPEFQRGWVWRDFGIRSLIASVTLSYPIGAVMFMETGGDMRFATRPVEGAPDRGVTPEKLILDGQQRLTSLFLALRSGRAVETRNARGKAVERWYYLDLKAMVDPHGDRVDAIVGVPSSKVITEDIGRTIVLDLTTEDKEFAQGMMPLHVAFDPTASNNWLWQFGDRGEQQRTLARQVQLELARLHQYQVPVIELTRETPRQAICQVFENVNTGGVALTVFELLTATFAAELTDELRDAGWSLRKDWTEVRQPAMAQYRVLQGFSEADFLQAITLLVTWERQQAGGRPTGCKRKDLLELRLSDYLRVADRVVAGARTAARLLQRERVYDKRNLPYGSQMVPLAAICAALGTKAESDLIKRKLARWFWCGVFGELYGGSTETRFSLDMTQVIPWVTDPDAPEPRTVTDSSFDPNRLVSLRTRNSAAYKGVMAILLQAGSCDLMRGDPIELTTFFNESVDIHHVFPSAWCKRVGIGRERADSIVNKTPLSRQTNQSIGGRAPSRYLQGLEAHVSAGDLDGYLQTHLIAPALLRADDFDTYFRDRACRLLDAIEHKMGRPIQGRDSERVRERFGGPLVSQARSAPTVQGTLYDRYDILEELAGGAMAHAYRVLDRQADRVVFLKRAVMAGSLESDALHREASIYEKLMRARVPGVLEVLEIERDENSFALVTEYADGGTLSSYVNSASDGVLSGTETKRIASEVLATLRALHAVGVVHRDLKPGNVLRHADRWMLADFGIAKNTQRLMTNRTFQQTGSPGFAPPEQRAGAEAHPSADIYHFGKLVTFMLTGGTDPDVLTTPSWSSLVRGCTHRDASLRLEMGEVEALLAAVEC